MEVHPILECGDCPSTGLWYVVSPDKPPESRVGVACVARCKKGDAIDEVLAIGGANPSATFSDVFRLNLRTFQWNRLECKGFRSRYEHAGFIPSSFPNLIYVFGGANKSGNLDCLQSFDTEINKWSLVTHEGQSPGPRTLHCAGFSGDKMYIFGGGHLGSDPVPDLKLHIFDAKYKSWTQQELEGDAPSARHGHAMVVSGSTLYIHGGMAGTEFYDDLYAVNLQTFKSQKVTPFASGAVPCARAGHSASSFEKFFYIFGGMCLQGALDDFCAFDTSTSMWTVLKFDCPPPAPRLDHSVLCTLLPVKKEQNSVSEPAGQKSEDEHTERTSGCTSQENGHSHAPKIVPVDIWQGTVAGDSSEIQNLSLKDSGDSATSSAPAVTPDTTTESTELNGITEQNCIYVPVCMVIGGMDTAGNLFNDILITRISDEA